MASINFYSGGILQTGSTFHYYQRIPQPVMLRTDMESGPAKQRPYSSQTMVQSVVTYLFTDAEYNAFLTWFYTTAAFGSLWFNWTDPADNTVKDARIVGGQISDARPVSPSVTHWMVTFTIEVYN